MRFRRVGRRFIVSASAVEKPSARFPCKMRIHVCGRPASEIIAGKEKAATAKILLDAQIMEHYERYGCKTRTA